MYFVYVLKSKKDRNLYIGYSSNLKKRLKSHMNGLVLSTKNRRPLQLIYCEIYIDIKDAKGREIFLKSGSGHKYLKKQLRNYLLKSDRVSSKDLAVEQDV
ncbi:MAG TPA: GIY-YIG nuclease family protein [Candidatus Paceibacterota bacterium]|nr:GIY-YIG nuclease family protein [Candidatus Paceibacterota bacterium]